MLNFNRCLTLAILALALGLAACSNVTTSPDETSPADVSKRADVQLDDRHNPHWLGNGAPPEAAPITADELVAEFIVAHDSRDHDLLGRLFHEDYLYVKQDGSVYDRSTDLSIFAKMMLGRASSNGMIIADMETEYFIPINTWSAVATSDPNFGQHPGAVYRSFSARFNYSILDQELVLEVEGLVLVYAVPTGDTYQLLGMRDMTYGRERAESVTWTDLKAMFE